MSLLWATRGRVWGFRFIRTAGLSDPLPTYEKAFSGTEDDLEIWRRLGNTVAARLLDPEGRKDQSGRPIFHDFVVEGDTAEGLNSTHEGRQRLWSLVAEEYECIYDSRTPPKSHE